MKICYFNSGYLPDRGGVATLAAGLAEHIAEHPSVELVRVIAFKNSQPRAEKRGKLEIFTYGTGSSLSVVWFIFRHIWWARDFDVFHATNIFPVGFLVLLFGKYLFGKKVFLTLHGTDTVTTRGSRLTRALKRWTLLHCDGVLPNSRSTADLAAAANRVPLAKFTPVYVGVDEYFFEARTEDIRKRYGLSKKDFVILNISQMIPRKGVDDLIRAVAKIPDTSVKLLILGKGPEKENLQTLAEELQIKERVIFAGTVDHSEVGNYYKAADMFALTSKFIKAEGDVEGFGIVSLEAQFFGKPALGTRSGGIPETLRDGETGFLIQEGDSAAMAKRIALLRDDPALYERMSRAAREFVRKEFSWNKSIERHLKLYMIKS